MKKIKIRHGFQGANVVKQSLFNLTWLLSIKIRQLFYKGMFTVIKINLVFTYKCYNLIPLSFVNGCFTKEKV